MQILEIQAIDKDTGNNARITYRILNNGAEEVFKVQPSTGWVYLAKMLDRETVAQHKMIITATDNGIPPLSASASLIVNVIDANDNDPVFTKAAYEFLVEENQKIGAFVGKIAATDADLGDNAVLRYSLFPTNTSFNINPNSGKRGTYISCLKNVYFGSVLVYDETSQASFSTTNNYLNLQRFFKRQFIYRYCWLFIFTYGSGIFVYFMSVKSIIWPALHASLQHVLS